MKKSESIWSGPFDTWQDACSTFDLKKTPWALDSWISRQSDLLKQAQDPAILIPPRPTNLPLLVAQSDANSVLDYGGGSGWVFETIKKAVGTSKLRRSVVAELASAIPALKALQRNCKSVEFVTLDMVEDVGVIDLVYSNAALHYAENLSKFLSSAEALEPKMILIDGYLAHPNAAFYLTQKAYGVEVPVAVRSIPETLNEFESHGFVVSTCMPMLGPVSNSMEYGLTGSGSVSPLKETLRWTILAHKSSPSTAFLS